MNLLFSLQFKKIDTLCTVINLEIISAQFHLEFFVTKKNQ